MSSDPSPRLSAEPFSVTSPQVSLSFKRDPSGQTFIAKQFATYPFTLTQPFYFDRVPPGMPTLILQSISGGVYEKDRLALDFSVADGACVHLTTQGATVVHSMQEGRAAVQHVSIQAGKGSFVEYLPDPLALFPQARFRSCVHITVEEGATAISGDAFGLHDPESPESLARPFASFFNETVVQRPDGQRLCIDRFEIAGHEFVASLPPALRRYRTQGTLWVVSDHDAGELVTTLRTALGPIPDIYAGASALPHNAGAWLRVLAVDAVALRNAFHAAWSAVRLCLTGVEPPSRRKSGWL